MSNLFTAAPASVMRADALSGVRTRRIFAVCIDFVLVSLLVMVLWIVSIVLTLGLALFFLPPLFPFSRCAWTMTARASPSSMRRSRRCCFT
jgi:hypothetical protein